MTDIGRLKDLKTAADAISDYAAYNEPRALYLDALEDAAPHLLSEIETLRAENERALAILQELVAYDNGGSGEYGAIIEAAEQILASHKENTDV